MNGFRYFFLLKNIFFCVFLHYFFCFVIPYSKIYANVYINPQKSFVQRYSFKFLALDSLQHNNPQLLSVKTRDYTDRTRIMYLYSFTSLETQLCPVQSQVVQPFIRALSKIMFLAFFSNKSGPDPLNLKSQYQAKNISNTSAPLVKSKFNLQ